MCYTKFKIFNSSCILIHRDEIEQLININLILYMYMYILKRPGYLSKTIFEGFSILFINHFNSYINYHHQWLNNNVYKEISLLYTNPKGLKFSISYNKYGMSRFFQVFREVGEAKYDIMGEWGGGRK